MAASVNAGFIGLGVMGAPMARNVLRGGARLVVWNRSIEKCEPLAAAGAAVASSSDEVFGRTAIVLLMLADESAIDAVLHRHTPAFRALVRKRTIVQMGTVAADYSASLASDVARAGGAYVEAPVSGSRTPAENAELIAMLAGNEADVERVIPLVKLMCRECIPCGAVPNASLMKLAVNLFLITMVTGLSEAVHFADANGINMEAFRAVLDGGPMASAVSRGKLAKLIAEDYGAQAAVFDVLKNNRLIAQAARNANIASPLLDACHELYEETMLLGRANDDMIAVVRAIEERTSLLRRRNSAS